MGRVLFVTGTDTGVGKTVAAAWLALVLPETLRVAVVKAVETGVAPGEPGDEAFYRRALAGRDVTTATVEALPEPLAPSVAARRAGRALDITAIAARCLSVAAEHDVTLVEGAGGLLVTMTPEVDCAGLAKMLGAGLVIVIRPGLGTLNHTMLTVEAAERRGLAVEMLVCSGMPPERGIVERENMRFLRGRYPDMPLVVLPWVSEDALARLADLGAMIAGPVPEMLAHLGLRRFVV